MPLFCFLSADRSDKFIACVVYSMSDTENDAPPGLDEDDESVSSHDEGHDFDDSASQKRQSSINEPIEFAGSRKESSIPDIPESNASPVKLFRQTTPVSVASGSSRQVAPRWGQSDTCRVSGWGQLPTDPMRNRETISRPWLSRPQTSPVDERNEYEGPIETWPNYRSITAEEWEMYKANEVVYTDGSNVEGQEPGWLYCKLCSKKCASKDLMQMHIESGKHQRYISWRGPQLSSISTPTDTSDLVLTEKDRQMLEQNRCEVEEGWIVCKLCNKKFMDMSFLPEHIGSRKHRNNIDWANSVEGRFVPGEDEHLPSGIIVRESDYYCTFCRVSMTSKSLIEVHVGGYRHTQRFNIEEPVRSSTDEFDVPIRRGPRICDLSKDSRCIETVPIPVRQKPLVQERIVRSVEPLRERPLRPMEVSPERAPRIPSPPRLPPSPISQLNQRWNRPQRFDPPNLIDI